MRRRKKKSTIEKPPKKKLPVEEGIGLLQLWTAAIKQLGIPIVLILFFTILFGNFALPDQKRALIDEYFLFRNTSKNPLPFAFIVVVLGIITVGQYLYYKKVIKTKEGSKKEVEDELDELQEELLNNQSWQQESEDEKTELRQEIELMKQQIKEKEVEAEKAKLLHEIELLKLQNKLVEPHD